MVSDRQKYKAQVFQVGGYAFFTPLGKLTLTYYDYELSDINLRFFINFLIALVLAYIGLMLIFKGEEKLE